MASALSDWSEFSRRQVEFFERNKFWESATKSYVVSKSFKGQGHNMDPTSVICRGSDECITHHEGNNLEAEWLEPHECDSDFSKEYLQGRLEMGHIMSFGHVMDVGFARTIQHFWEKRGVFYGAFNVLDKRDNPVIEASMDGIINVGTVREPLNNSCEKCHMVGRWHGRINGHVHLPDKKPAYLTAAIAMDVYYEAEKPAFNPVYFGAIEGMLIRECGE